MTLSEKERTVLSLLLVNYRPKDIAELRNTSAPNIYEFIRNLKNKGYIDTEPRHTKYTLTEKGLKELNA